MLSFTAVDPSAYDADHPSQHATRAEIRLARAAGRAAHAADRPDAPGADANIVGVLIGEHTPVGQPRTRELFEAFSAAYDDARTEAIESHR